MTDGAVFLKENTRIPTEKGKQDMIEPNLATAAGVKSIRTKGVSKCFVYRTSLGIRLKESRF